ncbi:hypothetical protein IKF03_00315 [Candidatus Saccharibacteria bacterium]|nr:hypothetical protein [Candidatus Saccharibacteria bacterium]
MANFFKKRGQKLVKKFSRASLKASEESKEHIKENLIERLANFKDVRLLVLEWGLMALMLIMLSAAQAVWFGESYANSSYVQGGVYTEATIGEVKSLNPLFATTSSEKVLSRLMFATIATNDYSGHVGIGLAKSITPLENGRIWKVTLREGLKWSDGEDLTNADVLFTADLIKNPATSTVYNSNLQGVKVYESEEKEIVFELASAYADFMSALNFPIVPKHILENVEPKLLIENSFSKSPVVSGAFSFNALQSGASADEKVFYLTANPYYYKGKTLLNSFAVHTYQTKDAVLGALNSGSVTATAELSEAESEKINTAFIQRDSGINAGVFIFFNLDNEVVKNLDLRTAIRQGINLEGLRAEAPGTSSLDYPLLASQIKLTSYPAIPAMDFEVAKAKIAELSGGGQIGLRVATVNVGFLPKIARKLEEDLKNLGIDATVTVYEEGQDFITNVITKRDYDLLLYETPLGAEPDLLPYYHSSQASMAGLNLSNYKNYLVDDLLLGARDTMDEALRVKKYESFLNYWVAEVPAIGVYQSNLTYYYNREVRTYGNNVRLVTALDRFLDVNDWAVNKATRNKTP